jgi:hypothetical protein
MVLAGLPGGSDVELFASTALAGGERIIADFVDPTTDGAPNNYFVKVTPGSMEYALVVTRDASVDRESNDSLASAQDITLTGTALGALGSGDTDFYRINAIAGDLITVETAIPGAGPGDFINNLIALVELIDPNGVTVGSGPASTITTTASITGQYVVKVLADSATTGEYVLQVSGPSGVLDPFQIVASTPPDGTFFGPGQAPTQMTITLSSDVLPTSVDANDLTINGVPATGVTIVAANVLRFDLPPVQATGSYEATIAAGALTSLQNIPVSSFLTRFTVDSTGPRVIASSIQDNDLVSGGTFTYTAQFDESLATLNLDATDVRLVADGSSISIAPDAFNYDPGTSTLTVQYVNVPEDSYQLILISGVGAFADAAGNALDGEILASPIGPNISGDGIPGGNFAVRLFVDDATPTAFPTPLSPEGPLGSLTYDGATAGMIGHAQEADVYEIAIEKGQIVSVIVQGAGGLTPMLTLETPGLPLTASNTASGPNGAAVLRAIPTVSSGNYVLRVQGAGGTVGDYSIRVVLNADLENESHGGPDNGSMAGAQDLDPAFVDRATNSAVATVVGRGDNVSGPLYSDSQTQNNVVHTPNVLTFAFTGAPPATGNATLILEAIADLDGAAEFLTLSAEGLFSQDVFVGDGAQQQLVTTQVTIPQATLAALAADGSITFTVTPSSSVGNLGSNQLTLRLEFPTSPANAGGDWYQFSLEDGETASVVLGGVPAAGLELYNPAGVLLAHGIDVLNATRLISNVADLTNDGAPNTYFVRVASPGSDYSLVVVRNGDFDAENNDDFAGAQDIGGTLGAAGHIDSSRVPDEDWYQFGVNAGDILRIETFTPGEGAGEPFNVLDPSIELIDPNGNVISSASASGNEILFHVAQVTGQYRARVFAASSGGEYFLQIEGATGGSIPPSVVDTNPDFGVRLAEFPLTYTLTFSEELDPLSVQASDLTVGGAPAVSVAAIDGRTYEFTIDPSVNVGSAIYLVTLAADAVLDLQGQGNVALAGDFEVDVTGPVITGTLWNGLPFKASRLYQEGQLTFEAFLSEEVLSIGIDDVQVVEHISGQTIVPQTVSYDVATGKMTATFAALAEGDYTLTLKSGATGIEDLVGNDLDGEPFGTNLDGTVTGDGALGGNYSVSFSVDRTTTGVLQPVASLEPLGGLIFASEGNSGLINGPGDQDVYEFVLEAGHTLSAIATPADPTVTLSLQLVGMGIVTAAAPGASVVLPLAVVGSTALYELRVSGDGKSAFNLDVVFNAAIEPGGDSGDGDELAIDASLLPSAPGRYAVLGRSTASPSRNDLLINGSFETGTFNGWTTNVTGGPFRPWAVSGLGAGGGFSMDSTQPQDGTFVAWNGFDGQGPLEFTMYQDVTLPASGAGLVLSWQDKVQWDYTIGSPATLPRLYDVEVRDPANNALLVTLYSFSTDVEAVNITGNTGWQSHTASLSPYAGQSVRIYFREQIPQVSTGPAQLEIDAVSIPNPGVGGPDTDEYTLDLSGKAGQRLDVVLTGLNGADFSNQLLELLDDAGNVLAIGSADPLGNGSDTPSFDVGITDFIIPDVGSNVFTLRVLATTAGEYGIVVTQDVVFDTEPNQGSTTPLRSLDDTGAALGHLAPESVIVAGVVEPDEHPVGLPLNTTIPGVTLSVVNSPTANVVPISTSFAPTGATAFGRAGSSLWSLGQGLRADFAQSTGQVSITVGSDDSSDTSVLQAFDANNVLLESVTSTALSAGQSQILTITRPTNDIAFVIAGGSGGDVALLDRLTFNSPSTAVTGDVYELSLLAGQTATVFTDTPFDNGVLLPPNALDPGLRIIDPNGQVVATDSNSRDGKNAQLQFTATVAGVYLVQIEAESGTGVYVLNASKSLANANFDSDSDIDGLDFLAWQRGFSLSPATLAEGDATGDGAVDGQDLQHWQEGFGAVTSAPSQFIAMMATESNFSQPAEQILSEATVPTLLGLNFSGLPATTNHAAGNDSSSRPSHFDQSLSKRHSQLTADDSEHARAFAALDAALSDLILEKREVRAATGYHSDLAAEANADSDTAGIDELFSRRHDGLSRDLLRV